VLALVAIVLDVPTFRAARASRPSGRRIGAWVLALVAASAGTVLRLESGALGYAIDPEDIEVALGGRIETEHFIIHYAKTPRARDERRLHDEARAGHRLRSRLRRRQRRLRRLR
jgi:hypothetical protein